MHLDGCSSTKARLMRYKSSLQKYTFTYCAKYAIIESINVIKSIYRRIQTEIYI